MQTFGSQIQNNMDPRNDRYADECDRSMDVDKFSSGVCLTLMSKMEKELRGASQSTGNPRKPDRFGISQHPSRVGKENPSTVTKSLETLQLSIKNDTRDGPRELKTQTGNQLKCQPSQVERALIAFFLGYLQYYQKSGHLSVCQIIISTTQTTPKNDHPVDEAEVDGVGGSSTSPSYNHNSQNLAFPSSASKKYGNSKRQRGKRSRGDPPDRRGGKRSPSSKRGDESQLTFACPYYYADKERHWYCHRFAFWRIGDVRQHIKRKHISPIYCPVCGDEFRSDALRDEHINAQTCQHHDFPHSWATAEQISSMDMAANELNSSSDEERWFTIWDIMFPDRQQPPSPYISDTYWGLQASVTRDVVNEYRTQPRYQQVAGQQTYLVDSVLDDFISFLHENSHSSTPDTFQPPIPPIPSTPITSDPLEFLPQSTMPSIMSPSFQSNVPTFTPSQAQDLAPSYLLNPDQTSFFYFDHNFEEIPDDEFENINFTWQPGGNDNSTS
ncbi:uncharacterized protein GGS22DRAFT_162880 [Annulohypoxylon maeteangense]|uniref:uncharacterized protein n=1 Tax=Annulohypoxylon maeteangense TaxID=1927788 RepID=UPI0020079057|nr:uncharacterized protein GGS22DRAFT_162880 [Annulohypoxylon maeteangense]KAI0885145.1 hypothetical protein GGS22DRAFT_162880 [Annulohypoxylon maeteangense]